MNLAYDRHGIQVAHGDCLDLLGELPDASVDAVITDPPYGLGDHRPAAVTAALTAWAGGDRTHVPDGAGFMGAAWDSFVPPPAVFDQCLRVLKPGGHLACFAGTRTVDLMGLSIRLAGFEIRDDVGVAGWTYAAGFPKSRDISKDMDRMAGAEREVIGQRTTGIGTGRGTVGYINDSDNRDVTAPASLAARTWDGWGTALKPAWEPIILARKPLAGKTVAATVLAHGTGALNIAAARVAYRGDAPTQQQWNAKGRGGHGSEHVGQVSDGLRAAYARGDIAAPTGRWPPNAVFVHHPDCGPDEDPVACAPACPVADLDRQSGITSSPASRPRTPDGDAGATWNLRREGGTQVGHGDTGGGSRFFPTFRWEAKAPTSERPQVAGLSHPTTKPVALMRWLARLLVQPGGLVVDPFAGSGTTGQAARAEGMRALLIERDDGYLDFIRARLDARPRQATAPAADAPPAMDLLDLLDNPEAAS